MKISYNKLWHLMLDKKMNKADLKRATGISTASIAKLGRGENITTDILVKICKALKCELKDIMELTREDEGTQEEVRRLYGSKEK
ncbi:helix-turn-helix domain-containing protein [Paradesulfitobacterium ferrireducens]|uniref:helix-turn-helix domain-containing protein n=1 Tax=Paradesulfitobacterium ferrireducens TaxID=2816476 RepID=UPI001A8E0F07|nr:helix-turn-helix transcriptional regulator [Paradesulfitobacterium ferrireducens]